MRCIVKQLRGPGGQAPVPGLRSPAEFVLVLRCVEVDSVSSPSRFFTPAFSLSDSVPNIVLTVSHAECIGAHLSCFRAILTMYLFIIYF